LSPSRSASSTEALPEEVKLLSDGLARVEAVLSDPVLLAPFRAALDPAGRRGDKPDALVRAPSLAMATYLRLMWLKQTTGWGYERLMVEVSDSFSLRRFCRIPVIEDVPDESTVRKLTRRLGPEVVDEIIRGVIVKALEQKKFRPRALRADSRSRRPTSPTPPTSGCAPMRSGCWPRRLAGSLRPSPPPRGGP